MLRKLAAVLAVMVVASLPSVGTAQAADVETYAKCTNEINFDICMRLTYNDQGNVVVLKKIEFYVPGGDIGQATGWKAEEWIVKCVSVVSGQTLLTWAKAGNKQSDHANEVITVNPDNESCNEQGVRFTGVGILQYLGPDQNDDFGSNQLIPWD